MTTTHPTPLAETFAAGDRVQVWFPHCDRDDCPDQLAEVAEVSPGAVELRIIHEIDHDESPITARTDELWTLFDSEVADGTVRITGAL